MEQVDAEKLEFIQECLPEIAELPEETRLDQESQVALEIKEIADKEVAAQAYKELARFLIAHGDSRSFMQRVEDEHERQVLEELINEQVFGAPLLEVLPADLPLAGERLLKGKNVAVIVRAGTYKDLDQEILEPLSKLRGFKLAGTEKFPRTENGGGNSSVHLDNFATTRGSDFRYGLSVSQVERGQVVFIGGLATPAVYGWDKAKYTPVAEALNVEKHIDEISGTVVTRHPTPPELEEWRPQASGDQQLFGVKAPLVASTLSEGDIVIWPQGGPGAELPAWHGFKQVGSPNNPDTVARHSTSYHLAK